MKAVLGSGRHHYAAKVSIFLIMAALITGMAGCGGGYPPCPTPPPSQNLEIQTWYDLDAVRDNLAGNHTLMNELDFTTPGYEELASPTANQGKGWEPIGTFIPMCPYVGFTGTFDGQRYEIRDLFINCPDENLVGLFGCVYPEGIIKDIGVVNITIIGNSGVGGLVGRNIQGTISNSYAVGSVSGDFVVGGLVGYNQGPVNNCYATGNVVAGGAVGDVGAVIGGFGVGGLVGLSEEATVSSCHFTGNVTSYLSCADKWKTFAGVGGLVGLTYGTVTNSYSNANVIGKDNVGGLVGNNRGTLSDSYSAGSVTGNSSVGGLVGENVGDVSNSYSTGSMTGDYYVGGLVGFNEDTVSNSYSTSSVTGSSYVGGLAGVNRGTVNNSHSTGSVTGNNYVGGLVGSNGLLGSNGTVSNSFWDIQTSGQATSDGGTGKTTAEMQDITTFSGAGWDITTVALNQTNPAYIWNIVNNVTYPFLSWQPI